MSKGPSMQAPFSSHNKKPAGAGFSFSLIGQDGLGCEGWS